MGERSKRKLNRACKLLQIVVADLDEIELSLNSDVRLTLKSVKDRIFQNLILIDRFTKYGGELLCHLPKKSQYN